jgi:hypothetical protein
MKMGSVALVLLGGACLAARGGNDPATLPAFATHSTIRRGPALDSPLPTPLQCRA